MDILKGTHIYSGSVNLLALVGVVATVIFLLPWNASGFSLVFQATWLLSPYLLVLYFNVFCPSVSKRPVAYILFVVGIFFIGMYSWVDITYLHPDPLGIIAMFIITPLQSVSALAAWSWCK